MTEMVERVARELAKEQGLSATYAEEIEPELLAMASAAIEAMREPTEEMIDFGGKDGPYFHDPNKWHELPFNQVEFRLGIYQAMIDAALVQAVNASEVDDGR